MTPHQGSGAGQAIEVTAKLFWWRTFSLITIDEQDAYVLAAVLGQHLTAGRDRRSLEAALLAYEAVRLPLAIDVQRRSRLNGRLFDFLDVPDSDNLTADDLKSVAEKVKKNWEWAWTTNAEDDKLRALQILKEKMAWMILIWRPWVVVSWQLLNAWWYYKNLTDRITKSGRLSSNKTICNTTKPKKQWQQNT